ncbi:MAG: DUF2617 family protein [Planctomycetes bacterium]|nr:DUF2617 family protein [Planctomycetota bacterium]
MDSSRTEQSLKELTFFVYNRPMHPELFNIYSSRQFFQGEYEVIIWITDCGHVVSIFSGRDCLTELICPPDQMLPKRGYLDQFPFRGEKNHSCKWSKAHSYLMNFQVEKMSVNLFRQCHADLVTAGRKRGMMVSFPQWARGSLVPFSYLDYEAKYEELQVQTYHAFPEQQTILKTQSLFDLRRRK